MMHNDLLFSGLAACINFGGLFYPPWGRWLRWSRHTGMVLRIPLLKIVIVTKPPAERAVWVSHTGTGCFLYFQTWQNSALTDDATAVISVKLELPETSVNHGNNTMPMGMAYKQGRHRKHFVPFGSILWDFSQTLSWCGHTARHSDVMQMLPWPWPPAHTMLGPTWHRCRATFSLGQPGAALCRMWTVPTLLLCSLFTLSRFSLPGFNETLPWFLQSHTTALSMMLK